MKKNKQKSNVAIQKVNSISLIECFAKLVEIPPDVKEEPFEL